MCETNKFRTYARAKVSLGFLSVFEILIEQSSFEVIDSGLGLVR